MSIIGTDMNYLSKLFQSPFSQHVSTGPLKHISPVRLIVYCYLALVVLGAVLLYYFGAIDSMGWFVAIFTSVSAVTLTGLTPANPTTYLSGAGWWIVLFLIQTGAILTVTFTVFLAIQAGIWSGLLRRIPICDEPGVFNPGSLVKLSRYITVAFLSVELLGAIFLTLSIHSKGYLDWIASMKYGIFMSVSAFCNSGFLMSPTGHFRWYLEGTLLLPLLTLLMILGSIGIPVLAELAVMKKLRRCSLMATVTIAASAVLLIVGTLLFLLFEKTNSISPQVTNWAALGHAFFASASMRSAGFSLYDMSQETPGGLMISSLLMLIGGGPGGATAGLKVISPAIITMAILTLLRRKNDIALQGRRISGDSVRLATSLAVLYLLGLFIAIVVVTSIESSEFSSHVLILDSAHRASLFLYQTFDIISAYTNSGLTAGTISQMQYPSQWVIIITMLVGRIFPPVFAYLFTRKKKPEYIKYPVEPMQSG
jgi:trk system potassium uptake protein TrkH